jgi:hypothetical protein
MGMGRSSSWTADNAAELARLSETLRSDTERKLKRIESEFRVNAEEHLKAHGDRVQLYRNAADLISVLLGLLDRFIEEGITRDQHASLVHDFNLGRLRLYGQLGTFAPQSVMGAQDLLIDHLLAVVREELPHDFPRTRELGLGLLNAVRADLGIDPSPIESRGDR